MGDFSCQPCSPLDACHGVDAFGLRFGSWEGGVANLVEDGNQREQATGIDYSAGEPPSTVRAAVVEAPEERHSVCRNVEAKGHDSERDFNAEQGGWKCWEARSVDRNGVDREAGGTN